MPNDPADYGRNSFDTQTLNNVFESLKHPVVDLLKIDRLFDMGHSHELVYFMVKDRLLAGVRQLHLAIYIGKNFLLCMLLFCIQSLGDALLTSYQCALLFLAEYLTILSLLIGSVCLFAVRHTLKRVS